MNNYLEHHGILGMKWGKRRYQNPDGTLTAEGKARYGSGTSLEGANTDRNGRFKRAAKTAGKVAATGAAVVAGVAVGKRSNPKQAGKAFTSASTIAEKSAKIAGKTKVGPSEETVKKIKSMSDDELRKAINRQQMEQQYAKLLESDISVGKTKTEAILEAIGDVFAVGGSTATIAATVKKVMNSNDSDKDDE